MTAPELAPGAIVAGRYGIQALLKHAGSIATYQAITAPNREVALKLYDPALKSSPDVLKALARYQMVGSSLPGNWIASIVDSGEDPDTGAPYTVTDFEAHPSLAQLVELCPLSASEMVTFVRNVARGLDLLHANGIAHLALGPTNVFVGPAPAFETRVADFGTSLVRKALPIADKDVLALPWLAPEQVDPAATPGPVADVFALALVAFFAATGKKYWRSCQTAAPDLAEWKREITGPRTAASQRAKELGATLGQAFDGAFTRALAPSPKDRFASPGQFATALQAAAALQATVTGALPAQPPAPKPVLSRAPDAPRTPPLTPIKKPLPTMMGIGTTEKSEVPPPPPQLEAVLATFEAPAMAPVSPSEAPTQIIAAPSGETEDPIEIPGIHGGSTTPRRRSRTLWITGTLAALTGMIGAFVIVGREARPPATSVAPALAPTGIAPAASAIATAVPVPAASLDAPELPPEPAPEPAPAAAAPTPPVAAKPVRAPAWHRKPVLPAAPAPAKKPCGKFLKRCT